jgi:hypothetical protein
VHGRRSCARLTHSKSTSWGQSHSAVSNISHSLSHSSTLTPAAPIIDHRQDERALKSGIQQVFAPARQSRVRKIAWRPGPKKGGGGGERGAPPAERPLSRRSLPKSAAKISSFARATPLLTLGCGACGRESSEEEG